MSAVVDILKKIFGGAQQNVNVHIENHKSNSGGDRSDGAGAGDNVHEKDLSFERFPDENGRIIIDQKAIIDPINAYFGRKIEIKCQVFQSPKIEIVGDCCHDFSDEEKEEVIRERDELNRGGRPNDMHAILVEEPKWNLNPVVMRVKRVDYAGLTVLRKKGRLPVVVTANALVVCSDTGEVLLHKRSKTETDPNVLHVFGGGYMPGDEMYDNESYRGSDGLSLKSTVMREILEATTIGVEIKEGKDWPMVLVMDNSCPGKPFVQLNYIFCDVSKKNINDGIKNFDIKKKSKARDNYTWEGDIEKYLFKELLKEVADDGVENSKFALSGKAHILVWLALGCPGFYNEERREWEPGSKGALEVFQRIVNRP